MRCEGYRRKGGAFTLGPVQWVQCENEAVVMIECKQDGEIETFPACQKCFDEALEKGIVIGKTILAIDKQT